MDFLDLLRYRFEGKDNEVPWELDDKVTAYKFAMKYHVNSPEIISVIENIEDIRKSELPNKFVLKISNAHSSIGVMLLEKISEDNYFDHISLDQLNLENIVNKQKSIAKNRKGSYWILEQLLDNFLDQYSIPFDYKVYCFNGVPKIIIQIDRNTNNPKVAVFDGCFFPLKYGEDYTFNLKRWVPGPHIVPPHAQDILRIAAKLSSAANKFVSVDLYDTPDGVYFGEFTFCPGAPDTKMIVFSQEILEHLNLSLNKRMEYDYNTKKGFSVDVPSLLKTIAKEEAKYDDGYYKMLLSRSYMGDYKAIRKIALQVSNRGIGNGKINQHFSLVWKYISFLGGDNDLTFNLVSNIRERNAFVQGENDISKIIDKCKTYLSTQGKTSVWYEIRYAQFLLEYCVDNHENAWKILDKYKDSNDFARKVILRNRNGT